MGKSSALAICLMPQQFVNLCKLSLKRLEGIEDCRIEMLRDGTAIPRGDDAATGFVVEAGFVTAGVAQGIILVGQVEDAALDRDQFAGEPVGIAAAVVVFVMAESDLGRHAHARVATDNF